MKHHTTCTRSRRKVFVPTIILTWLVGLLSGCGSPSDEFRVSVDLTSLFETMADDESFASGEKRITLSYFAIDPDNQINKAFELDNRVIETAKFDIVGRIDEPYLCEVGIEYPSGDGVTYMGDAAIIGPKSEIQVGFDAINGRITIAGNEWHYRLVSSNPLADGLVEATEQFYRMYEEWIDQWRNEDGTLSVPNHRDRWITSFLAELSENDIENTSVHLPSNVDFNCSIFQEAEPNIESDSSRTDENIWPQSLKTAYKQMRLHRFQYLDEISRTSSDPLDRLLALDAGGLGRSDINIVEERLRTYDEIAKSFSPSQVARRIEPEQRRLRNVIKVYEKNQVIVPGQIAPKFVATDQTGNDVALETILAEHETVLLYLNYGWREINARHFVALEQLQKKFGNLGLAIVSVYVNTNETYWDSSKFDTPWQTLVGFRSEAWHESDPIVLSYGILETPKVLLLDDSSCILKLNPTFAELEVFLDSALAEVSEPE